MNLLKTAFSYCSVLRTEAFAASHKNFPPSLQDSVTPESNFFSTLKRGANNRCASGALGNILLRRDELKAKS